MDKDINTTFIPKKELTPKVEKTKTVKPFGLLTLVAALFFFTAIVSLVGTFLCRYKHLLYIW